MALLPRMLAHYIWVMETLLIVPQGAILMEAQGLADIFHCAQSLSGRDRIVYEVKTASVSSNKEVFGSSGLNLSCDAALSDLDPHKGYDSVIVCGVIDPVRDRQSEAISDWLKLAYPRTRRMASACTGAFYLASAGILRGRRATTHWKLSAKLAAEYPEIRVSANEFVVQDGNVYSSGGVSAAFDLGLLLVEQDLGRPMALRVARELVLYLRRPGGQEQFASRQAQAARSNPIREVQHWLEEHYRQDIPVARMAEHAAMSPRNFARLFSRELGQTPAKFLENLRLEAARTLLEEGWEGIKEVALQAGFGSEDSLRRVFLKRLGVTPRQYKIRFGSFSRQY